MNLVFAMYAKWFAVNPASDCSIDHALGCETRVLEDAEGTDTRLSGAVTFEASSFAPVPNPATLPTSTDGSCGASVGKKCPDGYCCSQYGFWYASISFLVFSFLLDCCCVLTDVMISGNTDAHC